MLPKLRSLLVCTIALLATSALSAQTFRNPRRIPTPVDPATIAAADLNGDGIADIVWGDTFTSPATFHVLLSQPGGGYLAGTNIIYPIVSTRPPERVLADVNNDKHADLICSSTIETTTYVHVFLGNGDGTFQPPSTTTAYTNDDYTAPVLTSIGDLNGDGFSDILVQDLGSGQDVVLLSDGKGAFQAPLSQPLNFINQGVPVAADVNGDGILDLLEPQGPEVALGRGDGTFAPTVNYSEVSYYAAQCAFHDMDGDGHLDAVCGYPETVALDITGATDLIILHGNPDDPKPSPSKSGLPIALASMLPLTLLALFRRKRRNPSTPFCCFSASPRPLPPSPPAVPTSTIPPRLPASIPPRSQPPEPIRALPPPPPIRSC